MKFSCNRGGLISLQPVGAVIRLLLDFHQPWQYRKASIFCERLPDFFWRFKEIRNTEDFSAQKKPHQKTPKKQNIESWTSLNIRRWWCLLYYSQELRLKGLNTSWHSHNFPDACPACSCRMMPAWGSQGFSPYSCQCVTDTKLAHRTLSVYLMSSKEQSIHGKFNHFLFSVITQPLPKYIASVICTWAQIHSSAPSNASALQLCSFPWVIDAVQSLLPSSVSYKRRENAGMGRIFTQWSKWIAFL